MDSCLLVTSQNGIVRQNNLMALMHRRFSLPLIHPMLNELQYYIQSNGSAGVGVKIQVFHGPGGLHLSILKRQSL